MVTVSRRMQRCQSFLQDAADPDRSSSVLITLIHQKHIALLKIVADMLIVRNCTYMNGLMGRLVGFLKNDELFVLKFFTRTSLA